MKRAKQPLKRLDDILINQGFAKDNREAYALIRSGDVIVDGATILSPSQKFAIDVEIVIRKRRYVSRGGEKLEGALKDFSLNVNGLVCADIGVSAGGFSDCLLKHGAKRVYGFDVGYGVVDYSLRKDERFILFERCNFRKFDTSIIKEVMDLIVVDVSFISVRQLLLNVLRILKEDGMLLILIKPQFEAKREEVERGGVIKDNKVREAVIEDMKNYFLDAGLTILGIKPSCIKGRSGNQEYFFLLKK